MERLGLRKGMAFEENSERCPINQVPVRKRETVITVPDRGDLTLGIGYRGAERLKKAMRSSTPC